MAKKKPKVDKVRKNSGGTPVGVIVDGKPMNVDEIAKKYGISKKEAEQMILLASF